MAKEKMKCVFSQKLCRDCALYRGRHYYICFAQGYRGRLTEKPAPPAQKPPAEEVPWYERLFADEPDPPLEVADLANLTEEVDLSFTTEDYAEERYNLMAGRPADKEHGRYFFHIDVWGCKARLCIVDTEGTGETRPVNLAIPQEVLDNAVFSSGGALLMAGHYPIDESVRKGIEEALVKRPDRSPSSSSPKPRESSPA